MLQPGSLGLLYRTDLPSGLNFIPTWVGPQAPCTTFRKKFSPDPATAYQDGINEANLAVDTMASFGLTYPDKSGSVIYYDLEAFSGDQACRDAVKSFMNGWVAQLHVRGNLAGVYGSTGCTNGLNLYLTIPNVPDVIWPAIWDHNIGHVDANYEPLATVWTAGCISTSSWNNHQRIRQYEGEHNETWGGVTINIDNDVIDGVVSVPYFGTPTAGFSAAPLAGEAPLTVAFYITNTIYMTSCSWNYGDGQTGTSCAASHSHTYTSPGTYTVSLTATGPGGSNSVTRANYVVVSQPAPTARPDLVPFPRVGRSNPLSLSSLAGTTTDGTLYAGQPTYIDWGFKNIGTGTATGTFAIEMYIDAQRFINYNFAGLAAGASAGYDDWLVTWPTVGWHTVRLVVDPANTVAETDETNNIWAAQFYWEPPASTGPTTISPTGVITTPTPSYIWNAVTNAVSYELQVDSITTGSNVFKVSSIIPAFICSGSTCTYQSAIPLSPGDYQFRVAVKYVDLTTAYSSWMTFTVGIVPATPSVSAPTGTITDTTPTFSWSASTGASWYELYIFPSGSTIPIISYTNIPASTRCIANACTFTPTMPIDRGNYQFHVRAANLAGASAFSVKGSFTMNADANLVHYYFPYMIR